MSAFVKIFKILGWVLFGLAQVLVVPFLGYAVVVWWSKGEAAIEASFVLFLLTLVMLGVLLWRIVAWARQRPLRLLPFPAGRLALVCLVLLLFVAPAASNGGEDGGVTPDVNSWNPSPQQLMKGCAPKYHVWDTGYNPTTLFQVKAYNLDLHVSGICWIRGSYVLENGIPDIKQSAPPRFVRKRLDVRVSYSDEIPQVDVGDVPTPTIQYFNCRIEGRLVRGGCMSIRAKGKVHHLLPGIYQTVTGDLYGYPQVSMVIDATGRVRPWWDPVKL